MVQRQRLKLPIQVMYRYKKQQRLFIHTNHTGPNGCHVAPKNGFIGFLRVEEVIQREKKLSGFQHRKQNLWSEYEQKQEKWKSTIYNLIRSIRYLNCRWKINSVVKKHGGLIIQNMLIQKVCLIYHVQAVEPKRSTSGIDEQKRMKSKKLSNE